MIKKGKALAKTIDLASAFGNKYKNTASAYLAAMLKAD
jgi:hypothetical protein